MLAKHLNPGILIQVETFNGVISWVRFMQELSSNDVPIVSAVHALSLMREALALLDHAGASLAACQLQHAINTLDPPHSSFTAD
ncbi:hypothetical protein U1872_21965 [Sphingomonas sp. RB3P16]|uniref:hypothetical protein n=1 Tax=Parasphingomonas frigoris TaxID=3096163 RepID=UPI002FC6D9B7